MHIHYYQIYLIVRCVFSALSLKQFQMLSVQIQMEPAKRIKIVTLYYSN